MSIGDHSRYLPIHFMYGKLGANFCSVLLNAHVLRVCDMTSKVWKKGSATEVKPDAFSDAFDSFDEIKFLHEFQH